MIGTGWSLYHLICEKIFQIWIRSVGDHFTVCPMKEIPIFNFTIFDTVMWKEDAFQYLWSHLDVYAFPSLA